MLLQKTLSRPFLIDGIGAIITALMLGVILPAFQPVFGMPTEILHLLSGVASAFALYSLICHFFLKKNRSAFLRIIAMCNAVYCLITLGLMVGYREVITGWGIAYFVGEIAVVLLLVRLEWNTARAMRSEEGESITQPIH